ncbi:MAG: polysaccharide biosynthesis/export family protein [Elusimicrobiota bacterium]
MKILPLIISALIAAAVQPADLNAAADKTSDINSDANYHIRSGDMLDISVYPQAELSGKRVVGQDGSVVLPTLGRVDVRGKSVTETIRLLEKQLGLYFRKPKVSLSVVQFSRRHVILTGEIRAPGLIRHVEGMSLSEVIVNAGGFTNNSDRKNVRVYRGPADDQEIKIVDVDAILARGDLSQDYALMPGDRVEVPLRVNMVFIWGAIKNAGSYDYVAGMKMLDVVTRANGLGSYAKIDAIRIFREGGEVFDVDFASVLDGNLARDVPLRPGDIIYVPDIALAKANQKIALITPWTTLLNLITTVAAVILLL